MKGLVAIAVAVALCVLPAWAGAAPVNKHAVAVIIGNKNYDKKRVPQVAYAHRDAEAIKRYVITSDVELLAYRERDDALGLTVVAGDVFHDNRTSNNG